MTPCQARLGQVSQGREGGGSRRMVTGAAFTQDLRIHITSTFSPPEFDHTRKLSR